MQKFYLLCLLYIACSPAALAQKEKLERMMDHYAAHDNFNGTVLIARHGAVLLSRGYGYRDERSKAKNTESTIYQLGTNTMPFTAEVMVQLDSKGRLGLEDRLSKYLPEYPAADRITLKNLLTQTSGIYNYARDPVLTGTYAEKPMSKDAVVARFKSQPMAFAPGTGFEHSSSGYFLLGMVIEKITHKKYERELKEDILFSCSMSHTGFDFAHLRSDNKAVGYNFSGGTYKEAPIIDSSISFAAAALYSTTADLLSWHRALLHHRLLPKDWQDLAYTPYKNQYALGWNITNLYGRKLMQHAGEISGFTSYIVRQEDDDVLIVLLENVSRQGEGEAAIANNIVQCLYDKNYQLPWERRQPAPAITHNDAPVATGGPSKKTANTAQLKKYVGEFEITPAFTLTFTLQGNELYTSTPENKSIKMIQETETLFRADGWNAEIEFIKSSGGAVNKIVMHQQGQLIPGVRSR